MLDFSINSVLNTLLVLLLLGFTFRYIINPLLLVRFYHKQGFTPSYFPIYGIRYSRERDFVKHKDFYYGLKKQINSNPNFLGFTTPLGDRVIVTIGDAKLYREFAHLSADYVVKAGFLGWPFHIWPFQRLAPKSMTFVSGEEWKKQRKIMAAYFNFENLKKTMPLIQRVTERRIQSWSKQDFRNINIDKEFETIIMEAVEVSFFGKMSEAMRFKDLPMSKALPMVLSECFNTVGTFSYCYFGNLSSDTRKWHKLFEDYMDFFNKTLSNREEEIRKNREKISYESLMDHLIAHRIDNGPDSCTYKDMVDNFIEMIGSSELTFKQIKMCVFVLERYPEHLAKVRMEIQEVVKDIENIGYDEINRLEFTKAVMSETLRIYFPGPISPPRIVLRDFNLCNISIKKGTIMNFFTPAGAWDQKYFKNPEKFIPERWLEGGEASKIDDPFIFAPFSAGPRNCIGMQLSNVMARLCIIILAKKFDFKLQQPYELKMAGEFLYDPAQPIIMDFTKRY